MPLWSVKPVEKLWSFNDMPLRAQLSRIYVLCITSLLATARSWSACRRCSLQRCSSLIRCKCNCLHAISCVRFGYKSKCFLFHSYCICGKCSGGSATRRICIYRVKFICTTKRLRIVHINEMRENRKLISWAAFSKITTTNTTQIISNWNHMQ